MSFAQSMGNIKKGTTNSNSNVTTIIQSGSSNNLNSTNYWDPSGSSIYYNSGNVGIGTNNPKTKLDVSGNLNISGVLNTNNDAVINNITIGHGGGNSSSNTAIGYQALKNNLPGTYYTGINNVASGFNALASNTSGSYNVASGYNSLALNSDGSNNVAYGYNAGYNNTGNYNTFIGSKADVSASTSSVTNSTAIGYNAKVTGSHQIMLGTSSENVVIPSYIQFSDGSKQYTAFNETNCITGTNQPHGVTGEIGFTGAKGPGGVTGEIGFQGPKGNTGEIGFQGAKGPSGITGENGFTGPKGNTGEIGFEGAKGPSGITGENGFTGPKGNTGDTGFTGPTGSKGPLGYSGDIIGPTGPTGSSQWGQTGSNIYYNSGGNVIITKPPYVTPPYVSSSGANFSNTNPYTQATNLGFFYYQFTTSGSFTYTGPQPLNVNYIIVGGGGSGGKGNVYYNSSNFSYSSKKGGGGEGGQVISGSTQINSGTYSITVGAASASSFNNISASPGANGVNATSSNGAGGSGGNGGDGGSGGSNGSNGPQITFLDNDASGVYFSGGGGGGGASGGGVGGGRGGVVNNDDVSQNGSSGSPNTGGGGGGGTSYTDNFGKRNESNGGSGGSGVVLLYFTYPLPEIAIAPSYIQFPDGSQQVTAPGQQIVSSNTSLAQISSSITNIQNIVPLPIGIWLLEGQVAINLSAIPSNFWLRLGFSYSSTSFDSSGNYIQDYSIVTSGNTYTRITGVINQTTNSTIYLLSQYGQTSSVTVTTNSAQLRYTRIA